MARRDYRSGSVYQRCEPKVCPPMVDGALGEDGKPTRVRPAHTCRGRWMATIDAGWNAAGNRRRITLSAKTYAEVKRKLRDKKLQIDRDGLPSASARSTVKSWSDTWLEMKKTSLRPKAYNAMASPTRKWIVPTIGHRRLEQLTPADVRAVAEAQRKAGVKPATTHRVLLNMLRSAIIEGHHVPARVLMTKAPVSGSSDRLALTVEETIKALLVVDQLPHGTRWAFALMHGQRQGECLGLTWDSVDFEAGKVYVDWQLQALPYLDRKNRALGFRVPDDLEVRHLVDAYHLIRPKSTKGIRAIPLLPEMADELQKWRAVAPANPWGLVWPTAAGRPANPKHDLLEWHAIQCTAEVGHPAGRYYHVHECRNVAATALDETGASENVITSLLGHASIVTSRGYMTVHDEPKRAAMERVGRLFRQTPAITAAEDSSAD